MKMEWYKDMTFYQIWARSFADGNGDGVGDLWGVLDKLDYIKSLGVDGIWFNPLYVSPDADFGYDVADYRKINPVFGDLDLFRKVLKEAHSRGLKVIMDLVVNHTSDEHSWFQASRRREDPYTDYYIWRPGRPGGGPPNNWDSIFGGSAWQWDDLRGEYYLHLFSVKQADLNMDNPAVRREVEEILRFWLDLGVDGFREDVITYISKEPGLPDDPSDIPPKGLSYYSNGPRLHEYLRQFRHVTDEYDCFTLGEAPEMTPEQALTYIGGEDRELDLLFQFAHMKADCGINDFDRKPFSLRSLKKILSGWQNALYGRAWNTLYLENHDHARVISRYGSEKYPVESGKMLAAMMLLMQGTAFLYQGQEIGMRNLNLPDISDYPDVQTQNAYQELKEKVGEDQAMEIVRQASRVSSRTPMQWDVSANAGFSPAGVKTWMPVNPNYRTVNVAAQQEDPDSLLNFYRSLLRFRKEPVVRCGTFREYDPDSERFYIYERAYEGERLLVVCSFSEEQEEFRPPYSLSGAEKIFGNYPGLTDFLRPCEMRVYRMKKSDVPAGFSLAS